MKGTCMIMTGNYNNGEKTMTMMCGTIIMMDPGKGVCADPVNGGAILGKGGPDPHSRDREHQLAPDKGRGKT